jgi:diguanylate cyclase (GGDEF)-like protein/PAS domain S-box-containing protein
MDFRRPRKASLWRAILLLAGVPAAVLLCFYQFMPDDGLNQSSAVALALFLAVAILMWWHFASQQIQLLRGNNVVKMALEQTGDAIIITDAKGCVEFLSPLAEKLTGWTSPEAHGRAVRDILSLRNAHTHAPLPDPIERALAQRLNPETNEPALLVRRDGRELPIEESAAPILDREDHLSGAVMVFRDMTEQHVREERALFTGGPAVMFRWRAAERWPVEYVSPNITSEFGYQPSDFTSGRLQYLDVIHPGDLARVVAEDMQFSVSGVPNFEQYYRIRTADGDYRWVYDFTRVIRNEQGVITHYHGYLLDVTEQRQSENDLRLAACVFDHNFEGIMITDAQGRIVRVNPAFTRITGYRADEVIGKSPSLLSSGRHDRQFFQMMWKSIHDRGHWRGEIWNRRSNGEIYPQWLVISVVRDPQEGVTNYVGVFTDISDYKQAAETIRRLAYHDALTNLPNRPLLIDRLKVALASARREAHSLAVLFIDLDHFKDVNDRLGHAAGDNLLRLGAERLNANVREGDTVGRMGGDEFVVVLNNVGGRDEALSSAARVAAKIHDAFSSPFTLDGVDTTVTSSIGIALFPQHGDNAEDLLRMADIAMYQAKSQGRDNFQFYRPGTDTTDRRHPLLERDLREALDRREFSLVFQPQAAFGSGAIVGVEALLRWRHPERGPLLAAEFIPQAEDTGVIQALGEWVMREALTTRRRWLDRGIGAVDLKLAINASSRQLRQSGFATTLGKVLTEVDLDPRLVEIELTESSLLHHTENTLRTLDVLRAAGTGIVIDDFGTGYSIIASLKRFPISAIKIAPAFVRNLPSDASDAAIVTAIIRAAQTLGLRTIAEGVETEAQYEFLKDAGCWAYQGNFYSQPLPAAELETLLKVPAGPDDARTG